LSAAKSLAARSVAAHTEFLRGAQKNKHGVDDFQSAIATRILHHARTGCPRKTDTLDRAPMVHEAADHCPTNQQPGASEAVGAIKANRTVVPAANS
jgi:hypothetical protein